MLIKNGKIITWNDNNEILDDSAIIIKNGKIHEIGLVNELSVRFPDEEIIDAEGQFIMPGNICAHTHFYGAFSRGMAIPGNLPQSFPEILEKLWWPLDRSLQPEDIKYSALVCIVDAIKHGTTTLIDHHASQNSITNSLDHIAEAVEQTGIRASTCYEVTDRDGEGKAFEGIKENVRFFEKIKREQKVDSRMMASFGLHASLTLSDKTLFACREQIPDEAVFHIHAAEHTSDQYDSLSKSGLRVVDRLDKYGILKPNSIVAHAVHVDIREIEILRDRGVWVTHQPRSNMNNAVGLGDVESLLRAGVKVGLGNDGFSNTMWSEWKDAYLSHKHNHRDPQKMNGMSIIELAVKNNAKMVSQHFGNKIIGQITEGAEADLIFVDYHPITPLSSGNLPWHILFGFNESMVTTTMVAGKVLMRNRELIFLDEAQIAAKARSLVNNVWRRYQEQF